MKIYVHYAIWHPKNQQGIELLKKVPGVQVLPWNQEKDGILLYPTFDLTIHNDRDNVLFGPHLDYNSLMKHLASYQGNKPILYNVLSSWCKNFSQKIINNPRVLIQSIHFPVNTEHWQPAEKKLSYFVYIKHTHPNRVNRIQDFLNNHPLLQGYESKTFVYGNYQESDYHNYLPSASFGIWIGSHESQGFAFQEALSCNVPLFVYDVTCLQDEIINDNHPWGFLEEKAPATSASYFDSTCGMLFYEEDDLSEKFSEFFTQHNSYHPRQFVLQNLTEKQTIEKLKDLFGEGVTQ